MKDKSILTEASYNTYENVVKHFYFNRATVPCPPRPPAAPVRQQEYSFIMNLGDGKPIVRVIYHYNTHPTKPNWYIIDLAIAGITNGTHCFEVLLCDSEPYFDVDFKKDVERGNYFVREFNLASREYIPFAATVMEEVIPRIYAETGTE
jgi:hypothetical protein